MKIKDEKPRRLSKQRTTAAAATIASADRVTPGPHEPAPDLAKRLLEIGKACAASLKEPFRSTDHGDQLYDDQGLPN